MIIATILNTLFITSNIHANLLGDYIASDNPYKVDQRRTLGTGSRSNCNNQLKNGSIELIVPSMKVVHFTTQARPNLYLSSKNNYQNPFKFFLIDAQSAKTIAQKDILIRTGVNQISLPSSVNLKTNRIYLWYIGIPCGNNDNQYEVLNSSLKRILPNSNLANNLNFNKTNEQLAKIYAINGIWYDAIDYAFKSNSTSYINQLLLSAGVNQIKY
ncbi:hypothetical protein NIES4102_41860 (plasmid) [Chondrocystis sp. NIES-4102]|nr:hypothetical protein NIES4102_41860 [Chondrocystis sp. NIES-4102]